MATKKHAKAARNATHAPSIQPFKKSE